MIDRGRLAALTWWATSAIVTLSVAFVADISIEAGLLVLVGHLLLCFLMLDVFRDYTVSFPLGVFSCLAFLLWGPAMVPWALAGTALSYAIQFALWRRTALFLPPASFRVVAEQESGARALVSFCVSGLDLVVGWFAGMMIGAVPYVAGGGSFPARTDTWTDLLRVLALLVFVNAFWLAASELRAGQLRAQRDADEPASLSSFVWALFGVYVPLPGTVLVLFALEQFHEKGLLAMLLWNAVAIPLHFGVGALLAANTAHWGAERERDRQRQLRMIAAQSSTILHEAVHEIGVLSLLLPAEKDVSTPLDVREARKSLARLERTIDHFRVSLRRHEHDRVAVALRSVLDDACRSLGEIELRLLRTSTPTVAEPTVLAHAFLLQHAIANVLRNAAESAPEGPIDVALETSPTVATLTIRDHGPGVPPEDVERLFEPSHSRKGKGLGLGLYLAREIFAAHGGSIDLDASISPGAAFRISVPLVSASGQKHTAGHMSHPARTP